MGWTDKYHCNHEFEVGEHINYYASPQDEHNFKEMVCTKCGYKTEVQASNVDTFLAARKPKEAVVFLHDTWTESEDLEPTIYAEILQGGIPDSAVTYMPDYGDMIESFYAISIIEKALEAGVFFNPDYVSGDYISKDRLEQILSFLETL